METNNMTTRDVERSEETMSTVLFTRCSFYRQEPVRAGKLEFLSTILTKDRPGITPTVVLLAIKLTMNGRGKCP